MRNCRTVGAVIHENNAVCAKRHVVLWRRVVNGSVRHEWELDSVALLASKGNMDTFARTSYHGPLLLHDNAMPSDGSS